MKYPTLSKVVLALGKTAPLQKLIQKKPWQNSQPAMIQSYFPFKLSCSLAYKITTFHHLFHISYDLAKQSNKATTHTDNNKTKIEQKLM